MHPVRFKSVFYSVVLASMAVFPLCAGENLGSVGSVFQNILNQHAAIVASPAPKTSATYSFEISTGEVAKISVWDYFYEEGQLSMTGYALESQSQNSEFIIKGNSASLYGWLVLKDKNIAYEYITDPNGQVMVNKVPVTKIFPICMLRDPVMPLPPEPVNLNMPQIDSILPHVGVYDGTTNINKLQSIPGAKKVLYIEITEIQGKGAANLWQLWQGQSAAYSMYDVNVTTDPAVYTAAGTGNSGRSHFYNQSGRSSCGGGFGTGSACTLYLDGPGNGYSMARTVAHETGHQMGLAHDGGSNGGEYFNGFSAFKWTPMMGNYWPGDSWGTEALYQWSKGEYTSATNTQDDLTVIARNVAFKQDDFPGTSPLKMQGTKVPALMNRGRIGKDDEDVFSFKIVGTGSVNLTLSRIEYMGGAMLDIDATIKNSTGAQVLHDNKNAIRGAVLTGPLPAGDYTLVIKGGAEGTPQNGFSSYSSTGYYSIDGEIVGGVSIAQHRSQFDQSLASFLNPSHSLLNLRFPPDVKVSKIALTSLSGKTLFSSPKKVESIDLSALSRGFYLLQIEANGESIQRKISRF